MRSDMTIDTEKLRTGAAKWNIILDETALSRFDSYASLLIEWNQKINLTAIKDPDGIVTKHFIDSLALLSFVSPQQEAKVIDVGTGAGFPGVALLIARPDLQLTLLDSTKKKASFFGRCPLFAWPAGGNAPYACRGGRAAICLS